MAAPLSKDITNLEGTWHLNRKLSDDPDQMFALQGVPWITRKALRFASLSLQISQSISCSDVSSDSATESPSEDGGSVTTLHVRQTVTPGSFNSETSCVVNGQFQDMSLPIFGDIKMKLQYVSTDDIKNDLMRQSFEDACASKMVIDEGAENPKMGWSAHVLWGFENIHGKRYLTRNVRTWKNDESIVARMVYDCHQK
ncbi:uncharacterized protein N7483_009629 [Penicillium malachiteum]|uniref:uncharacterized protein n=1 Tax=Penicillium malachiteum TaxID=1324776 RepID=UPI0025480E2F|nr:uncharacterized protein N7483_009629 [Penicillium malachiteum]KAJ5721695.1 hypothetical protein N7483_009629 [Penicillium malachiteum]